MGFLIELPELLEGRVQSNGIEIQVTAMVKGKSLDLLEIVSRVREEKKACRFKSIEHRTFKQRQNTALGLKQWRLGEMKEKVKRLGDSRQPDIKYSPRTRDTGLITPRTRDTSLRVIRP